ncbi:DUF423 domain-containing protein [Lishizhenia sp.]|uniref:DUF423 domain-containing protein n=1 Tax=Lishizhenia sp. TaxID=2497594 RepID=UPI00299EC20B|nr:DUF423 domain-containing protein [Lishizhenia sp.]MDX1444664.1 DUF423 domain-containing protein [Lishizhenia sp.]
MDRKLISIGLGILTLAILLGAFAAHGLESLDVAADKIRSFETGVRYLFYTSFGLMLLSVLMQRFDFEIKTQYRQILWGTVLFSLSIFLLVLIPALGGDKPKFLGPVTPLGGVLMILGWGGIFVKYVRTK